ncbi:hypothetical protein FNV43_RR26783 [Rhamnella rubrinervis]|uniref:Adenylosuccinate synthetase n=1 Tax=Rhamnella rubrinervis TaxID=2594499 RepID=A0A8K0DPS4_9ROSA|nr:hypothetical protein FNV43_RR26783 [Rhamnella rubrinervis]
MMAGVTHPISHRSTSQTLPLFRPSQPSLDSNPLSPARSRAFGTHLHPLLISRSSKIVGRSVIPSAASALSVAQSASQGLNRIESLSQVSGVLGCQWGDEGKGKLVDILAQNFDIVARCQIDGLESNGVSCEGRILISYSARLLFDFHQEVDGLTESEIAKSFVDTAKRGIAPAYSSKAIWNGIRFLV